MNILHITTYLQGGAGRIIKDLAIEQKKKGNNVTIVINNQEEAGYENYSEYIDEIKENKINLYRVDSSFKRDIYLNVQASCRLNKIIIENNINLIHTHAAVPSMLAMMAKSNMNKYIPIIQTMHGWGTNKNNEHEKMDVSILNMIDKVVTVSNSDKVLLVNKGVDVSKIKTIYNGLERKYDEYKEDNDLIQLLNENKTNGKVIIGCIGTVCERKNQNIIVDALKYVSCKDYKIIFLGEGDLIGELQKKARVENVSEQLDFIGYVDKAYLYLKYFDYVLLPSLSEGLPLTILEAYRAGIPVGVSNIDCMKEIVEDKKNGFIFDKKDEKELAILIDKLIKMKNTDTYMLFSKYNLECFEKKFTIDRMYDSYAKLYESLKNN